MDVFAALASPRKPSVMEGRIEDTFYKDLKREWRSGSIAVMTESFKNLPFVVSIKFSFVNLYEKSFFFSVGNQMDCELAFPLQAVLENLKYLQKYCTLKS